MAAFNRGDLQQAEALLRRMLEKYPDMPKALHIKGSILLQQHKYQEACEFLLKASQALPDDPEVWDHLGVAYMRINQFVPASEAFARSLQLAPDRPATLNNAGINLWNMGNYEKSEAFLRRALELNSGDSEGHSNLGVTLYHAGKPDEALEHFHLALALDPDNLNTRSILLLWLNYLAHTSRMQIYKQHLEFDEVHAARVALAPQSAPRFSNPHKKLKLGFVSADLRNHSVACFLLPFMENLDLNHFEPYAYYNNTKWDSTTDIFKALFQGWVQCAEMSSGQLVRQVQQDGIDILFDLSGHFDGSKLLAFAARPAPIQVSWIGYPNTTGLRAMHYRLVDHITDPVGEADRYHTEKLIRLPHGFLCYRPFVPEDDLPVGPLPCQQTGGITFGSFNNIAKISPETLSMWARLLRAVPDARLILKSSRVSEINTWSRVLNMLRKQGVNGNRVRVEARRQCRKGHLDLYNQVDIALDTFPYHGTTTTCEALYMGVPVIVLAGDRHASRVSASLLARVGLDNLVATSPQNYVAIAVALAGDSTRLDRLRTGLRFRLKQSPLRDEACFTRTVEQALRSMWQIWCRGEEPRVFKVSSNRTYDFASS